MNLLFSATVFAAAVVAGPVFLNAQETKLPLRSASSGPVLGPVLGPQMANAPQTDATRLPGPVQAPAAAVIPRDDAPMTPVVQPALPQVPSQTVAVEPAPAPVAPPRPAITLVARVNLSTQRMHVTVHGKAVHTFAISSGRDGYITPRGSFQPKWHAKMWYSKQYDDAPMPHAVFFNGGIATHATQATGMLGRPASHGCVRLAPTNAAIFYKLVTSHGMASTKIIVEGSTPIAPIAQRRAPQDPYAHYGYGAGQQRYGYVQAAYPSGSGAGGGWSWGSPFAQQQAVYIQPAPRAHMVRYPAPRPQLARPGKARTATAGLKPGRVSMQRPTTGRTATVAPRTTNVRTARAPSVRG